jgi:deoxyribodipyrimidine photo-lyase
MMETALWWVRRDLRLRDNQALNEALACASQVVPVFVLDPALLEAEDMGPKRMAFLLEGLRALDRDLRTRGSRLVVRRGEPGVELERLLAESGAEAIFAEADFSPYARQRDGAVAAALPLERVGNPVVHPPGTVLKADGTPYVVFTPFSRKWKTFPLPRPADVTPPPARIETPDAPPGLPLPEAPSRPAAVPFPAGEGEAQRRLRAFAAGEDPPIHHYAEARDRVDRDGTSRLSPYLRFGMLSARQAVATARAAIEAAPTEGARAGASAWLDELIWREFYVAILYHFPQVLERSFREKLRGLAWENDEEAFEAWCAGRTGYPIVDAGMRQLTQRGWMHNRARMIVASFLVKDLLIDWRRGARFFMEHLVDGDPAANNGGWQWTAGTGTDAAPYFRIFNPVLQGEKHDPEGAYVRRWVPELARVPTRFVHEPWKMPRETAEESDCVIGRDYPAPLVEHGWARKRALAAYAEARERGDNP